MSALFATLGLLCLILVYTVCYTMFTISDLDVYCLQHFALVSDLGLHCLLHYVYCVLSGSVLFSTLCLLYLIWLCTVCCTLPWCLIWVCTVCYTRSAVSDLGLNCLLHYVYNICSGCVLFGTLCLESDLGLRCFLLCLLCLIWMFTVGNTVPYMTDLVLSSLRDCVCCV